MPRHAGPNGIATADRGAAEGVGPWDFPAVRAVAEAAGWAGGIVAAGRRADDADVKSLPTCDVPDLFLVIRRAIAFLLISRPCLLALSAVERAGRLGLFERSEDSIAWESFRLIVTLLSVESPRHAPRSRDG